MAKEDNDVEAVKALANGVSEKEMMGRVSWGRVWEERRGRGGGGVTSAG